MYYISSTMVLSFIQFSVVCTGNLNMEVVGGHAALLLASLNHQREQDHLCDCVLRQRQDPAHLYPAHKCILAASSPVLATIISSTGSLVDLQAPCLADSVLELVLDFIYTGVAPSTRSWRQYQNLLAAACLLEMEQLREVLMKSPPMEVNDANRENDLDCGVTFTDTFLSKNPANTTHVDQGFPFSTSQSCGLVPVIRHSSEVATSRWSLREASVAESDQCWKMHSSDESTHQENFGSDLHNSSCEPNEIPFAENSYAGKYPKTKLEDNCGLAEMRKQHESVKVLHSHLSDDDRLHPDYHLPSSLSDQLSDEEEAGLSSSLETAKQTPKHLDTALEHETVSAVGHPHPNMDKIESSSRLFMHVSSKKGDTAPTLHDGVQASKSTLIPFQCSLCPRSFSQRGTLNRHMRSHLGVRPFPCPRCPMSFSRQYRVTEHMRIHQRCLSDCQKLSSI
ncbi:zinc finger and BTB domain-containing protein 8A-like isoform X2 [Corythoichthys intestinalis]|uniref:zinc finger and BTB domain-containing protein 8A-like isoform X2 n=1 Tax=Corythoichthys intestinalis TaxID=161448 RepID=UPI0025A5F9C3|nr:zinc finger and BTB domain-containing protein 8A-like isoform X2 [Corythoichthys intestinalis]